MGEGGGRRNMKKTIALGLNRLRFLVGPVSYSLKDL